MRSSAPTGCRVRRRHRSPAARITVHTPRQGVAAGIGLVPEDRKAQGLVLTLPIRQNVTFTMPVALHQCLWACCAGPPSAWRWTPSARRTTIRAKNLDLPVSSLSGGNQQKVVLAKWLDAGCKVIILDEPTRGVDVGARSEIYGLIEALAATGLGVILISSDLHRGHRRL